MLVRTMHHYRERRDNSKGVNHFSIQRIVFPTGAKMLILATDAVSKFNTGRLPWQPAGNKKTNTTFSHLQPARIVQSSPNFAW